jgi:hypothetical protein
VAPFPASNRDEFRSKLISKFGLVYFLRFNLTPIPLEEQPSTLLIPSSRNSCPVTSLLGVDGLVETMIMASGEYSTRYERAEDQRK